MKSKKLKRFLALALSAALLLSACSSPSGTESSAGSAPAENAKYRETLHIAVTQQAPSLDLHKNSSLIARQICDGTVWEKLVTLNSKAEAVPELAEKYEATNDGKTLTFTLRKGVLFHDGSEMTADDVVASMNRWIEGFSSAGEMVGDARFVKVDDHTVKIDGASSLILLPAMIAGAAQPASITTAEACKNEDANGFLKDYIGTGPYRFVEWKQDQYIKLERFDKYSAYGTKGKEMDGWSGYKAAPTKVLEFDIVADQATESAGLEAGQYDAAFNVPYDDFARLQSNSNLTTVSSQMGTVALIPNHKQGIASKQWFRTAVNTALDYDELLAATFGKGYELGSSYMDAGQPFWKSDAGSENYNQKDPEKAKKILADNGYKGETFTVLVATLNKMDNMGIAIKSQLEKIGIPVKLTVVDWATLTDYRKDPAKFDMYITSFAEVPVPSLKLYFGPKYPGWSDDEKLSKLFKGMTSAPTLEEAKTKWDELQGYSWEYLPIMMPGHYMGMFAWQKNLTGVNMYSGGPKFWNAGIVES
ncbi:MAG TPA: peptide ABC transporter substrate-binding protein [Ruminococcaceae bacterium]|nr:peptide ABC transporter substrate-binding protein [Oscillospiraceae bacterium]